MTNLLFCYYNGFESEKGGVQKVAFELATFLINNGFKVFFLSGKHSKPTNSFPLNNQMFLPDQDLFSKVNKKYYHNIITEHNIKIIINHDASNTRTNFFLAGFPRKDVKMISFHHNDPLARISNSYIIREQESYPRSFKLRIWLKKLISKREVQKLINGSDKLVFLSPGIIKDLENKLRIKSPKICQIYNPLPMSQRESLTLNNRRKRVICVGRIDIKHKRLDLLLKIWQKVEQVNETHELIIIGGGDDEEKVKELANYLGLKRVRFTGFTDPKPYYQTAEVSVLTSDYEGFSMVMVESLYFGAVPILFNNWAAVEDFVINDVNGVVVEPGNLRQFENSLLKLLNDTSYQEKLRQNHLMTLSKLNPEEIGNSWLNLINNLISEQ